MSLKKLISSCLTTSSLPKQLPTLPSLPSSLGPRKVYVSTILTSPFFSKIPTPTKAAPSIPASKGVPLPKGTSIPILKPTSSTPFSMSLGAEYKPDDNNEEDEFMIPGPNDDEFEKLISKCVPEEEVEEPSTTPKTTTSTKKARKPASSSAFSSPYGTKTLTPVSSKEHTKEIEDERQSQIAKYYSKKDPFFRLRKFLTTLEESSEELPVVIETPELEIIPFTKLSPLSPVFHTSFIVETSKQKLSISALMSGNLGAGTASKSISRGILKGKSIEELKDGDSPSFILETNQTLLESQKVLLLESLT